jgi:PKD domain
VIDARKSGEEGHHEAWRGSRLAGPVYPGRVPSTSATAGAGSHARFARTAAGNTAAPRAALRALAILALAVLCALLLAVGQAGAVIQPVQLIDGPSSEIVSLGGAAMAADGTGGIVYLKRVSEKVHEMVGGQVVEATVHRVHVFASQYANDQWYPPQRVDVGQQYESSFPAIAAGEGGRLVVVWVNHYSRTTDGLFSASLEPGSSGFETPVPIDLNIGQATGTYPSVAMDGAGGALVAYRAVTAVSGPSNPEIPPGYVLAEIRMSRFDGEYWSSFGQPINRNPAQPMVAPTALNSPKVAIDVTGQGLVVWQEPDDSFINRIYARRIFGTVPGNILQVSPSTFEGHPLNGAADEFALDTGGFGEGAVAFRQQPAPGSGFSHPRVFVNEIPTTFDPNGQNFKGARLADGGGVEALSGVIGPLSMAVDGKGDFDVGFGSGNQSFDTSGSEISVGKPVRLDSGSSTVAGNPVLTRAEDGALAAAWRVEEHGAGAVGVLERRADGTPNRQLLSAPHGGAVRELDLGGSHRGDALVGFLQGEGANAQIAALAVRAPPGEFVAETPSSWTRAAQIPIEWETPLAGAGQLSYDLLIDDEQVAEGITEPRYVLSRPQVGNGVHTLQIEATDALGQVVDSSPATLKVYRSPPKVKVSVHGASVTVRISEPSRESPGVAKSSVRIHFGDGHAAHGRTGLKHRYAHAGTYTISVTAADKAGNKRTTRIRVRVT